MVVKSANITVYTTPTCPWCARAKEFLSKRGVAFQERDVSTDRQAAEEVVRRTGQMGVPVIADEQEAILGFDLPRLQRMATRHARPGLGLMVADAKDEQGAYVGSVRSGPLAERAGVQAGDLIQESSGIPIRNADDLERIAAQRPPGQATSIVVRRAGQRHTLIIPV
jgi:glutaredoxin-like YruB-family protein